jgi:peptidoglycan/LPS O-acetylase OafA/YrhL
MPCPDSAPTPEPARIPSLDGLRALSIFLVVSLHTLQRYGGDHVSFAWYALFNGQDGVDLFFVISGFLITSLLLQEQRKGGRISLRDFYLRRAFRILPPLYFYICVVLLLGIAGRIALDRLDLLSSFFFFHNLAGHGTMWSLEHLWSISVEEQFYLVWPCILFLSMKWSGIAGRFPAAIFPVAILAVSPVARVLFGLQKDRFLHDIGAHRLVFDYLMYGCLVALLQHTPRFEQAYRAATRFPWIPPALIAACSIATARYGNYFDLPIGYTINGAAIAIFLLWCTRNPHSAVGRVLNWAPVVKIGVLSYSIYLWQTIFLHHLNFQVFGPHNLIAAFPLNWLGFFLAACFSYYLIEQPSLRLRGRLVKSLHVAKRQSASI